jgi:beta-mannanase
MARRTSRISQGTTTTTTGGGGISISTGAALAVIVLLSTVISSVNGNALIGAFDPDQGRIQGKFNAMNAWQGKTNAVQTIFSTFDQSEQSWLWPALLNIWGSHAVPMITWEPKFWAQGTQPNIEVAIARGDFDSYVVDWGNNLKTFLAGPDGALGTTDDRRAFLRFAHEMNGNWYPWSATLGQSSPQDYVNMWRRVYNLFVTQCGISPALMKSTLKWVWSPINFDVGDFKMEQYYPGDDVVDWVGTTGFNWGTSEAWSGWWGVSELFAVTIPRLRAIVNNAKPVAITEYSSVSIGQGLRGKAEWMNNLFAFLATYDIRMIAYFNTDKSEGASGGLKDWSVFGGSNGDSTYWDAPTAINYNCLAAYKNGVQSNFIVGSDVTNGRVLTDEQFSGFTQTATTILPVAASLLPAVLSVPLELPVVDSATDLVIFQDSKVGIYNFMVWGSPGVQASTVYVSANAEPTAPEGSTSMKVHSTSWAGAGFFVQFGSMDYMSLTGYSKLKFSIATTVPVRIDIQDRSGNRYSQVITPTSEMAWRQVSISLSKAAAVCDLNQVFGLFLATTEVAGDFLIDNVRYQI